MHGCVLLCHILGPSHIFLCASLTDETSPHIQVSYCTPYCTYSTACIQYILRAYSITVAGGVVLCCVCDFTPDECGLWGACFYSVCVCVCVLCVYGVVCYGMQ